MKTAFLFLFIVPALFATAETKVALGSSDFADTEAVTNVAFSAEQGKPMTLRFDFNAEQDNNAEVVFGCDADGDGALSEDEERFCLGWECGRWKLVDCRDQSAVFLPSALSGITRAYWDLRIVGSRVDAYSDGTSTSLVLSETMDQSSLNMVKVVCRGIPSPNLSMRSPSRKIGLRVTLR